MFVIEYLVIVKEKNCKTVKALKNLIQTDDDFTIVEKNKIKHKDFLFNYDIVKGVLKTPEKSTYFHLTFSTESEENIVNFTLALKGIKNNLSFLNKFQYTLWDDVTKYYAEKAYAKIFHIENLMRKLLTKFMLVNLGMKWYSKRTPGDVEKSMNPNNKDLNFLHNIDFIQLSNFLFSENYPVHKESLVRKLKQSSDITNINIDEIKSLIPESNWEKYFEKLVDCEAEYLKKRWRKLYDLRNKIAHNKTFNKYNLGEVEQLTNEIKRYLDDAISNLDEVVVPEEEIENVAENVASERGMGIGSYIYTWREFESCVEQLFRQLIKGENIDRKMSLGNKINFFHKKGILSLDFQTKFRQRYKYRNTIVHDFEAKISESEIDFEIEKLKDYIQNVKKHLTYTEQEHISKIKNKKIITLYKELKAELFKLPSVKLKANKHYISFVANSNVVDIQIQQKAIKIWLNLRIGELEDKYSLTKDVSKIGHLGNGDYEMHLKNNQNIEEVVKLIKQSYSKNSLQ